MTALLLAAALGAQITTTPLTPPIALDSNLRVELTDYPESAERGTTVTFRADVYNDGPSAEAFDQAMMIACPPDRCFIFDLYSGPDIFVEPGESIGTTVRNTIPAAAPTGEYHITVQIMDDGVLLDFDEFYMDVY
jgi:uncharacterized membrane protein